MDATVLLQWHYLIFVLPFAVAALMLLLSATHLGHHAGSHSHGPANAHSHSGSSNHHNGKHDSARDHGAVSTLAKLLGAGRAPLIMVLEAFCLGWGFTGFWANELLLHTPNPPFLAVLPSLAAAAFGGLVTARVGGVVVTRLLPADETFVVSRNALFGTVGTVTFPVTQTAGRLHVYDEFGSLHDESCRVAAGYPTIERGRQALVIDMDPTGNLIVEEVARAKG
jgi:hypothetical protein